MEHFNLKKGFTLIELMVSVAIFSIVMVLSLGALLSISQQDRQAETVSSVMNNLDFALESMTRNIRTGYDYHCGSDTGGDCTSGGTYFKFTGSSGTPVAYQYDTSSACAQAGLPVKGCITRALNGGSFLPITAPEIVISNLTFYLRGSVLGSAACGGSACDNTQPNVVIVVQGYIDLPNGTRSSFNVQTSATQRLYDR